MIISVNWLKELTDIDLEIDELATRIGSRLVEIEEVIDLGPKYKDVVIVKVVECEKLDGSDHLNVIKIDDGNKVQDVERDDNGYVQVVCGAPNVRAGMMAAWLPPRSVVPETFDTAEPFMLDARKLRGVVSNGMLASAKELALYDDHEGILEIDGVTEPGASFAEEYRLNDYLLDIENKSLTHRPDTFGVIGFAREVAGIQEKRFVTPPAFATPSPDYGEKAGDVPVPKVTIDDPYLSDRYQAVVIDGVDATAQSGITIQSYLSRVGVRPISRVVDVTNYLMMHTGQPLHAFDYDKLKKVNGGTIDIHVRGGREGETLELLDGRTINLSSEDIVVANGETAVALAGAMGGAATEIDDWTTTILLESATFNLYNLRATQMRHGIFSEAITRFTKGQPAALTAPVLAQAIEMFKGGLDAKRVSDIADCYPGKHDPVTIEVAAKRVNKTLGDNLTIEDMIKTLEDVEFTVEMTDGDETDPEDDGILYVTPPYWRADIHIPEDIIEEIGRLNGFDTIEPALPRRDFVAVSPSAFDKVRSQIRRSLVRAGANEVLTYSFVHGSVLTRAGQKPEDSYRLTNSLSPELQYYRQTLTPSLLGAIHPNVKKGYDSFALFEINKAHPKQHGITDEGVPEEADMVALVVTSKKPYVGAPFYKAKKMLQYLGDSLGLELLFSPIETDPNYPVTAPFEYRRSALVTDARTNTFLGIVGEYKKSVVRGFKLPEYTAGFEIGSTALLEAVRKLTSSYKPVSRYPGAERDVCFRVDDSVHYSQIVATVRSGNDDDTIELYVTPVDIYKSESEPTKKNITVRITLTAHDRTLTGEEIASIVNTASGAVVDTLQAVIV